LRIELSTSYLSKHAGSANRLQLGWDSHLASFRLALEGSLFTRKEEFMKPTSKALIIGGGVAGPALSLFLKKAGISSALYEAYPHTGGVGGGLSLAPNGMNVLDELGLADKVKARGTVALENCFRSETGRVLARIDNGSKKYGQPAVTMRRADLHEVLAEEMQRQGIAVAYQKRLKDISYASDREKVVAHFADGSSADGDILVGADGIHSQTRQSVFPESPKPAYVGIIGIGGFVPLSALPGISDRDRQTLNFTFGRRGFFGYCGSRPDEMMWWSNLWREKELTKEELDAISIETVKQEMLAIYGRYHDPIPRLIAHTGPPVKLNIYDIQTLPLWHKGRVVLVGDAAHAVSPNAGQGASMALEDAICLAKMLRDAQGDHELAFERFERERKPRVERIVAEGRRRSSDKRSVTPFESALRNAMLAIFFNLFGERSQDWLYRYRVEWNAPAAAA
jgi:2-polyprenyl-6-methoxyphenol hydroxylase-like FAD-dependent oxidoreductase